jgi:hypothetical protein
MNTAEYIYSLIFYLYLYNENLIPLNELVDFFEEYNLWRESLF